MWYNQFLTGHDGVKELALEVLQMSSVHRSHCSEKWCPQIEIWIVKLLLLMTRSGVCLVMGNWSGMEENTTG